MLRKVAFFSNLFWNKSFSNKPGVSTGLTYLLAFLSPALILLLAYFLNGIYPFGPKTVLICDLNGQYIDYYAAYYEILHGRQSLLYSWQAGLGLNFLGLLAYYLASPFSFLIVFWPKQHLLEAMLALTVLKIGTTGLAFAFFARTKFKISGLPLVFFAACYALMAYCVVYTFNLMWLDGVVFLPLVLHGTEQLLKKDRYLFLTGSLILVFLANYYISYMVGLFALLYFLAGYWTEPQAELKLFGAKLAKFLFSALLAAGCSAFLLLPTFLALKHSYGSLDLSIFRWGINFVLFDLLSKTQIGAYDTLRYAGLPNIYCGLLTLLLASLYFLNDRISVREKLIYLGLLSFLILSMNFSNLNFMWHAFDRPNGFPYRYSFVFSFLLLFLAVKSFRHLEYVSRAKIYKVCAGWLLLIVFLQKLEYDFLSDKLLVGGLILLFVYSFLLDWGLRPAGGFRQKVATALLACFLLLELTVNTGYLLRQMDREFQYKTRQQYTETIEGMREVVSAIQAQDQSFYRMDRIGGRSFNDPLNLNYAGVAHFSSMSDPDLFMFLRQIGFLATSSFKALNFAGSTPITESLLGIKYVISGKDKGLGYTEIINNGLWRGFQNNYALPISFLVSDAILEFDYSKDNNPFSLQEKFINLALGRTEKTGFQTYFTRIPLQSTSLTNAKISMVNGRETVEIIDKNQTASIEFTIVNPTTQLVYACFATVNNEIKFFLNDEQLTGYLPVYNKRIIDLGFHPAGKKLRIKLVFAEQGFAMPEKYFYGLTETRLAEALKPLHNAVPADIRVAGTTVNISVTVQDKERSLLFTSIPFDPGWQAFVDGRRVPLKKIANVFIGVELSEGHHEVLLKFQPKSLFPGLLISGLSLTLYAALCGRQTIINRKVSTNKN